MAWRFGHLWRGLCTNWVGTAGVVLTTSSFLIFLLVEALRLVGVVSNAYIGLITYMALPALFVLGLLLIPLGWWWYRRQTGKTSRQLLSDRFDSGFVKARPVGSKLIITIALLSLVNVLFLGIGGARMLHFMSQPRFCGTACHSVMGPEWAAYQHSPHARVRCVDCHVGEGLDSEFDAKLNGVWQMISVTFDLYERPIPTPVHNLRPARETCERCHWPEAFYGSRIKRIVHYELDRESTPKYTTLALKIGSGKGEQRGEIHWHVAAKNQVRYLPANEKRTEMVWVEARQPDGTFKRYRNRKLDPAAVGAMPAGQDPVRILDCVDCHNRATHIFADPEDAVDQHLVAGKIARSLPFAKRQALAALTGNFAPADALSGIGQDFTGFYRRHYPRQFAQFAADIDRALDALGKIYKDNIHPRMNVDWNVYANHLGHRRSPGCRRCHAPHMQDADGKPVPNHCTLCHSILAFDSKEPFQHLMPADPKNPECQLGAYLQAEFLGQQGSSCQGK